MKNNKFFKFLKFNFRLPLTILVVGIICAAGIIIFKLPVIDKIGNSVRYSLIAFCIIIVICLAIVTKLIRDIIGIVLFGKGEKSLTDKSSIKK